jgi:hypothetical protein
VYGKVISYACFGRHTHAASQPITYLAALQLPTGKHPRDPDVVLKRFKTPLPRRNSDPEIGDVGDGSSRSDRLKLYISAVPDKSTAAAKALKHALHEMQIANELLHHEIQGLRGEIITKKTPEKAL